MGNIKQCYVGVIESTTYRIVVLKKQTLVLSSNNYTFLAGSAMLWLPC